MAATKEALVKKKVVEILKEAGAWYCFPVASGYGRSGIPDILACKYGEFIAIECKSGNNTPTALQKRELNLIENAGGTVWVVSEAELPAFKEWCLK